MPTEMQRRGFAYWKNLIIHWLVRRIDPSLFAAVMVLMVVGLGILYSALEQNGWRLLNQGISYGAALCAMWIVANIPLRQLMKLAVPLYVLGLALLVGVALFGDVVNGARRWLNIGVTRIQPSEIMKIALPLLLAVYFDKRAAEVRWFDFVVAGILVVLPFWLVKRQPDLGTALLIAASGFYVIYLAGLRWQWLVGIVLAGLAALPLVWHYVLHGYQQDRVLTFLDPTRDPLGRGYHTIQATTAVGSGGVLGKGWLQGTQTHLDFLPEKHTDFILAVFAEEFGLLGEVVLLFLYGWLIARAFQIASQATSIFARLLAGSIALMFFTYAFVNMGMVSGILPVVGVPLPLISYGGTALVTLFIAIGILMNIQTERFLRK